MRPALFWVLLALTASSAWSQPGTAEFRVNTSRNDYQASPAVAQNAAGEFVVAWRNGTTEQGYTQQYLYPTAILAQRFDSTGRPRGGELQANNEPYLGLRAYGPSVAVDGAGRFVVVWGARNSLYARRYDENGAPLGEPEEIGDEIGDPDLAGDEAGNVVAAWSHPAYQAEEISGRIFDAAAAAWKKPFEIQGYASGSVTRPHVALQKKDGFVVVWGRGYQVLGRRFTSTGGARGEEMVLNQTPIGEVTLSVGADAEGGFVVAWLDRRETEDNVRARRFDAAGEPQGDEVLLGSSDRKFSRLDVVMDAEGGHLAAWQHEGDAMAGDPWELLGRRYDAAGSSLGGVVPLVGRPISWFDLSMTPAGRLAVAFLSDGDIYGRLLPAPNGYCVAGELKLCLRGNRFEAKVTWLDFQGKTGDGVARPVTDDTGAFYFFGPENLELMVKVLDGRRLNGHFWVFYGSLSNVEFTLTVTDTLNGHERTYVNSLGELASVGDTSAFPGS